MTKSATGKPKAAPFTPFPPEPDALHREGDWLWIPLRGEWRDVSAKPEEVVRQRFIRRLVEDYGYSLDQMDQERRTLHGTRSPRADIVLWQSAADKADNRTPILVIECKAESVEIIPSDYYQGESYARAVGCEFFVAHNRRFTSVFKLIPGAPGEFVSINEIPKANDWSDAKRLEQIRRETRAFNRKEFQDLLFDCHTILRDVHKMEPGTAFDTISKILFVKMYVERSGLHGTFTTDFIDLRAKARLPTDPPVHEGLFDQTRKFYAADDLFAETDRLNISEDTFRRIVKKLERFDLSKTSDDIKGLAFERFLGSTFRGNLGQFFTPRPIVNFMVDLLDPKEGEKICDPAAGSGGFLIRAFEHVRAQIARDIQAQKDRAKTEIEARGLPPDEEEAEIERAFLKLNRELLPSNDENGPIDTRVGRLAWECIFGCDAEPRAARTAKMNMIMHGGDQGGIHHHDGLVDIDGIFAERFDVVITNPPFGATVGNDQKVGATNETRVPDDADYRKRCARYGEAWRRSHERMKQAATAKTPVLDLFEIGKGKRSRDTEVVFVERCLQLLRPGGRMGIVLPDGVLNNPSLAWLRRWTEGKARLRAIVSLPEETFRSSDAAVKASLVFLTRFTDKDAEAWEAAWQAAHAKHDAVFNAQRDDVCAKAASAIATGGNAEAARILAELSDLGLRLVGPRWMAGDPPAYPRGIGPTKVAAPKWDGEARDRKKAAALKKAYAAVLAGEAKAEAEKAMRDLRAAIRVIDDAHNAALWAHVREAFDYPVFVAAPKAVGITATGETGETVPNDLPKVLDAYRRFEAWLAAGAKAEDAPDFPLPSAA